MAVYHHGLHAVIVLDVSIVHYYTCLCAWTDAFIYRTNIPPGHGRDPCRRHVVICVCS